MTTGVTDAQRALVERFYETLGGFRPDEWIELWHDDGVFEMPYSPEGFPRSLEGREAIYHHIHALDQVFGTLDFLDLEVHATDDPELVLAMLRSEASVIATGKPYANNYIALFRIRDGRLALYREYFDPLIVLDSFASPETLNEVFDVRA